MCSFLVQILYGVVSFASTAMTIVSMVTPGWSTYTFPDVNNLIDDVTQGILPFTCAMPGDPNVKPNSVFAWDDCTEWFNNLPWTEKLVVVCMCIGLAFQVVAFVWNIFSIFACCCKKYVLHPLSFFTGLAAIFLGIAVIVYAIFQDQYIELRPPIDSAPPVNVDEYIGYSFWLACGALALNIANMIVASIALCCARKLV